MRSKLIMLSGVLVTAGVIACGGGKGTTTADLSSLDPEAQYTLATAIYGQMQGSAQGAKNQLLFVQSVEPGKPNMVSLSMDVIRMITKAGKYGTMQPQNCPNGGTMDMNITPSGNGGTFTATFNNCNHGDSVANCTMTGSWEGPQTAPTSVNLTMKGGCEIHMPYENKTMTISNDLTWSYNIDGIGTTCQNTEGIKASITINGGPMNFAKNGKNLSIGFDNLQLSTDYRCTDANKISWGINGSMTYEDNFCANASVSINVSTNPDFYYDMSTNTCGGSMSINNGQVTVNANQDCSIEVLDNTGQQITQPSQTCEF